MVQTMKPRSVIIDMSIDQGGCVETSRPTTHKSPTFIEHGVLHCCIPNYPAVVARTATHAFNNAAWPFMRTVAHEGFDAACLKIWMPVLLPEGVTSATADGSADASKLGTVAAADGALQVTYGGKPLYWFSKDKAAGQVHGNVSDKWGKWSTVATSKSSSGSGGSDKTNTGTGGTAF